MKIFIFIIAALSAAQAVPTLWGQFLPMTISDQQEKQQRERYRDPQQDDQQNDPWSASDYLKRPLPNSAEPVIAEDLMMSGVPILNKLMDLKLFRAAEIAYRVGLDELLQNKDLASFTLFTPNDVALDKFDQDLRKLNLPDTKTMDKPTLTRLCKSWIVPLPLLRSIIYNDLEVDNLIGTKLHFKKYQQKITVNGAEIIKFDISPKYFPRIHVANKVINPLPEGSNLGTLQKVPQFSDFTTLVKQSGMQQEINADKQQKQEQQNGLQDIPWSASDYLKRSLPDPKDLVIAEDITMLPIDFKLSSLGLSRAAEIVRKVSLEGFLRKEGIAFFTVFAPSNAALVSFDMSLRKMNKQDTWHMDSATLTRLCKSWVVPRLLLRKDITNDLVVNNLLGTELRFKKEEQKITVNGVEITQFDEFLPLVHVTNRVMYPLPEGSILDTLEKVPQFSKFTSLVQQTGMQQDINANDITVLVPTNGAFDFLGDQLLNDLQNDPTKARQFIQQHMIKGTHYSAGLTNGQQLQTANENKITVTIDNDRIFVNDLSSDIQPEIIQRDMPATNGVFHVINRAILRPTPTYLTWY